MASYGHNSGKPTLVYRTCTADEPHTRVRNAVINDPGLPDDCLGVLVYLLSKPPDWIINPTEVANRFGYSPRTLQRRLNVLEGRKYYWQHQPRNSGAEFTEAERFVADDPAVRQICHAETERQICLAEKELAKSRGKKETARTTKMSSDPHDKSPRAAKRRHTNKRSNNKEIKDALNSSTCALDKDEINSATKAWNDLAAKAGLSKITQLTASREKHLRTRLEEYDLQTWLGVLSKIEHSAFLCGESNRGWRVDFDWLVKPSNFIKVLEGNYGNGRMRKASDACDFDDERWRIALQTYEQYGEWNTSQCGNRPRMPGCRVPEHLLKEAGL